MTHGSDPAAPKFSPASNTTTAALVMTFGWAGLCDRPSERQAYLCERLNLPADWFSRPTGVERHASPPAVRWLAIASKPDAPQPLTPESTALEETAPPVKTGGRKASRTGKNRTHADNREQVREILIDRLDTILMAKIDAICGR